jgi:multicomponent Na+:H+ antiporter subunit E
VSGRAARRPVPTWLLIGLALAVLWLFVRGVSPDPATAIGELLLGLAVGLPLAYGLRHLYADRTDADRVLAVAPYAGLYAAAFLWELLTANLDVAYRTVAPSMPIDPEVIVVPLRLETDLAVTVIANSITLTPGTLTMDYDEERNALYVHAIDGRNPDAVVAPIRRWEDYALVIFDEAGQPRDPTPEHFVGGTGGPSGSGGPDGPDERDAGSERAEGGETDG